MSKRYKILIEYDGRPFVGWQRQTNGLGVQGAIEDAIKKITGNYVAVLGSGRTDARVHALGQVAHFDFDKDMPTEKIMGAINFHLGNHPIAILDIEEVDDNFHARFDATRRHYTYKMLNRRSAPTFQKGCIWHVYYPLDAAAMNEAAQILLGEHDFTTFRHIRCEAKSPVRTIDAISVERLHDEVHLHVSARSFLHNQVRSIAGCLKMVGAGRWTIENLKDALEAKDRTALGFNAPPDGLYFMKVEY